MLSTISGIVQALTILLGAAFGIMGTLSKRDEGPLRRSDKIALVGIVVAAALALSAFAVEAMRKSIQQAEEMRRVADELVRQGRLLAEVQRGLRSIKEFRVRVDFVVPATHSQLKPLVDRWEEYISNALQIDESGLSKSGAESVKRDATGKVSELTVRDPSPLFPKSGSAESRFLLPTLTLDLLRPDAPKGDALMSALPIFPAKNSLSDLSLLIPLGVANPIQTAAAVSSDPREVFATLVYNRETHLIRVIGGSVRPATAVQDTGAIVSLMDLPGRQIVLSGLPSRLDAKVSSIRFWADTGSGRAASGYKGVTSEDLKVWANEDRTFVIYELKDSDFAGLAAMRDSTANRR